MVYQPLVVKDEKKVCIIYMIYVLQLHTLGFDMDNLELEVLASAELECCTM